MRARSWPGELDEAVGQDASSSPGHALTLEHEVKSSVEMQETFNLMTHKEVVQAYKRTPTALRLKAIKWPSKQHELNTSYWCAAEGHSRKLIATTALSDVGRRFSMQDQPQRWSSQLNMAGMVSSALRLRKFTFLGRGDITEDRSGI